MPVSLFSSVLGLLVGGRRWSAGFLDDNLHFAVDHARPRAHSQVRYYVARLKLLDAGLIEQAHVLTNFINPAAPSKGEEQEEEMAEGGGGGTVLPAQSAAELIIKMDEFVKGQLYRAKKQSASSSTGAGDTSRANGREGDAALDSMIYEERKLARKDLAARLVKSRNRCQRCRA